MSNDDPKYRVWDSYWQDRRILCPGPDTEAAIASSFRDYWSAAAATLPDGARVLDLACGNGFVTGIIAEKAKENGHTVQIDAIDAAAIDPKRYVPQRGQVLAGATFHPRTTMESLPFDAGSFDAVVSQYGIEFGNLSKSCAEVGRVLKPGGMVRILALPQNAPFIEDLSRKARQARHVLEKTKLLDVALAVAQAIFAKESAGDSQDVERYLKRFSTEVQRVVESIDEKDNGVAIALITVLQEILTKRKQMALEAQIEGMEKAKTRLLEMIARHEAIARAALGDASLASLTRELKRTCKSDFRSQPVAVGTLGSVAWNLSNAA